MRTTKNKREIKKPCTENTTVDKGATLSGNAVQDLKRILHIQKELNKLEDETIKEKERVYKDIMRESLTAPLPLTTDLKEVIAKKRGKNIKGMVKELKPMEKLKFKDKLKLRTQPENSYLIEMLFSNGTCKTFTVKTNEEIFAYKGRAYYLRKEENWFDLSHKERKLIFQDDYFCPINNKAILRLEDKNPEFPGQEKAFFSVTPSNAKELRDQSILKAILSTENLTKAQTIMLILVIIILVIQIIQLLGLVKVG